ncbi:MAG: hypothetical protein N4J56_001976 [Chroococcidiopsis sp. SAG 2025]|nr:hypothetical protein [Chroococcidiopsis sp. SAG 2025]
MYRVVFLSPALFSPAPYSLLPAPFFLNRGLNEPTNSAN